MSEEKGERSKEDGTCFPFTFDLSPFAYLERFAVACTGKTNSWSAQAMLALLQPKATLWADCGRSMASPTEGGSTAPALQTGRQYTQVKTAVKGVRSKE